MASVQVDIGDFEDGRLPLVCAVTGEPGATLHATSASTRVGGWFLLVGFWALLMRKSVSGWVPYSAAADAVVARRRRLFGRMAVAGVVATGAGLFLGARSVLAPVVVVLVGGGLLAFAIGLFLAVNTPGSVGARIAGNPRWIVLEPVHPAFAAAYNDERQRRLGAITSE